MDRRTFIGTLAGGLIASPFITFAQPLLVAAVTFSVAPVATSQQVVKVARVGILDGGSPYPERQALWNDFKAALREAGFVEGRNIAFDLRWTLGELRLAQEMANVFVPTSTSS